MLRLLSGRSLATALQRGCTVDASLTRLSRWSSAIPDVTATRSSSPPSPSQPAPPSTAAPPSSSGDGQHDILRIILTAVENVKPMLDVRSTVQGARIVYVPGLMHPKRQRSVAVRWIVDAARARKRSKKKVDFAECLALEILLAYQKRGSARQKRDDLHKLAAQSRANLNLRWWS